MQKISNQLFTLWVSDIPTLPIRASRLLDYADMVTAGWFRIFIENCSLKMEKYHYIKKTLARQIWAVNIGHLLTGP